MKKSFVLVIILLISLACAKTEVSGDYSQPTPDSLRSYVSDGPDDDGGGTSISKIVKGIGSTSHKPESGSSSRFSSSSKGLTAEPTPKIEIFTPVNEIINIEKDIVPRKKNGYILPGDFAEVTVTLKSNAKDDLELDLIEFVDDHLSVFYPSVHGYILNKTRLFGYYKRDIFDDLECGEIKTVDNHSDLYFSYDLLKIPIKKYNKTFISINKNPIDEVPFLFNKHKLFNWTDIENESLYDCLSRNPNLSRFLIFKLMALNENEVNNSKITVSSNNISIFKENKSAIIINKSNDCLDKDYVHLYYKNFVFHLKIENNIVYDTNNVISFDNITLSPSSIFVFWYSIKTPMETGSFDSTTLVANESKDEIIAFSSKEAEIENNPHFEATRTFSNYENFIGDKLEILFDIDYLGGGIEPEVNNISVLFDTSSEYEYISIDGTECNSSMKAHPLMFKSFSIGESAPINVTIKFIKAGKISPPSLMIDGVRKTFYDTVNVDRAVEKYFNVISLFMTAIPFLIIFILQIYLDIGNNKENTWRELRARWRRMLKLSRIRLIIYIVLVLLIVSGLFIISLNILEYIIPKIINNYKLF